MRLYSFSETWTLINFHRQRRRFEESEAKILPLPEIEALTVEALALLDLASYLQSLPEEPVTVSPWETMAQASRWWERRTEARGIGQETILAGFDLVDQHYQNSKNRRQ